MGLASLILAIASFTNILLLIAVVRTAGQTFQASQREETPFNYFLGTWMLVIGLMCVCGIVFGIGGLRQANRRHSMAAWGLCINIAIPLGLMFVLLIAQSTQKPFDGGNITEAAPGQPAYGSPLARDLQYLTVVVAVSVGMVIWSKRTTANSSRRLGIESVECHACRKRVPRTSRFCRRCGSSLKSD